MAVLLRRTLLSVFHRAIGQGTVPVTSAPSAVFAGARRTKKTWPVTFTKEELKERLTPMQYHVTQERGTESAFTGELTFNKDEGTYSCVVCGAPLFSSKTKFDSGSGWSVNAVASTLAGLNPNLKNLAEHKYAIRTQNIDYPMAQHYRLVGHSNPNSLKAMVIEQVPQNLRGGDRLKQLLQRESYWIHELRATTDPGLNEEMDLSPYP